MNLKDLHIKLTNNSAGHWFSQLVLSVTFLVNMVSAHSQDDYTDNNSLRSEDRTYVDYIKTVRLQPSNLETGAPLYILGSSEPMVLSFDDLSGAMPQYQLIALLCDKNWNFYDMYPSEYLTGYTEEIITNYRKSFVANTPYTNYVCTFPGENMKPARSGNYLLVIFDADNEIAVLSRRLYVAENAGKFEIEMMPSTTVEDRRYKQESQFVFSTGLKIENPLDQISATVVQNFRQDMQINNVKPAFVRDNKFHFDRPGTFVFDGNSEFRNFDTRSFRHYGERNAKIVRDDSGVLNFVIIPDQKRTFKVYESIPDIDGQYIVRADEMREPDIEAEYTLVHFQLQMPEPIKNGNIYLTGAFTNWQATTDYLMKWNKEAGAYQCSLKLKQGYYNYAYGFSDGKGGLNLSTFEGNHSITVNTYTYLVYYYDITLNTDRIIGARIIKNTNQKF